MVRSIDIPTAAPAPLYFPRRDGEASEPAPYVMTDEEAVRFMRLNVDDAYSALRRFRMKGWLKATKLGNDIRYLLPDVLHCIELAQRENPV